MNSSFVAHVRKSDGAAQRVADHLMHVSNYAGAYASKLGLSRAGELIGLLHDLGKYSTAFQRYIQSAEGLIHPDADEYVDAGALKGKIDHSTAGAQYVWTHLSQQGAFGSFAGQMFAVCLASHHSGLIDCISAASDGFGDDVFTRRMLKSGDKTHLPEILQAADPGIVARAAELLGNPELLSELKAVASGVAQSAASTTTARVQLGLMLRFLFSSLIDADRTDSADFESSRVEGFRQHGNYTGWDVLGERLETYLANLKPAYPIDALRRDISRHCLDAAARDKGIYTLTVPTGGGKTLASLRFALHHARLRNLHRVVYVIPFTSIIDQNADAVRQILEPREERGTIVLEHHSNLTPEQQSWRDKILSENWDAPVVYTTMVQFLEALFGAGTRGARRMHRLANSVLIFDEVQSLPVNYVHLFNNAINFLVEHCNATVVLCTATQPLLDRVSEEKGAIRLSSQHEMMPDRQKLFDRLKRVEVKDRRRPGGWTSQQVAQFALEQMTQQGSCLVIVNTKQAARMVYNDCAEVDPAERVHLSTNMCPAHRRQKLAHVRQRLAEGLPILCVSTQLIEAGVDVDFGSVIRFLAGIDSIAQAAGRCNRNGRSRFGIVHVVNPADEKLDSLPDIQRARNVGLRILDDFKSDPERYRNNLVSPEAISDYYRYYFFERRNEMSYPVSSRELGADDTLLNLLSVNSNAKNEYERKHRKPIATHFTQSFMTSAKAFKVIEGANRGVIVPFGKDGKHLIGELSGAFELEKQYELLKRAQQFTVNVFPNVIRQLAEARAVHQIQDGTDILYVDERYYSDQYGLTTEAISTMGMLDA